MRKLHLAIATDDIKATVADYTARLGEPPCLVIANAYALWRTASLNLSIRHDPASQPGTLRHMGWEDSEASEFSQAVDVNGIVWEHFAAHHQAEEIKALWPEVEYQPLD